MSPTEVRDWEGQVLLLNNNVISHSVRRLRGKQCIPVVVSRVITPGLERGGRQTGLVASVNSYAPTTLSDPGFSWVISNSTHPDFGTSVQPGPGSVSCDQRVLCLQRVDDRDFESFASDTTAEVRSLVLGAEELNPSRPMCAMNAGML